MKTPTHILALDQGTTSSRALVVDRQCRIVASAQQEFRQIYPQPGWVEHDPLDLWASQSATAAGALAKANLDTRDVAAVGIANQRETTLVWDADDGRPVYNAIVWQDRRTAGFCEALKREGMESMVAAKTGLRLDPYFSATKVRWILENVDGAKPRAEAGKLRFGTVDSWLLWQLTGGRTHATDATNASRTMLCNLATGDWDDDLLELFGIPRPMLPEIRSCSESYGGISAGHPLAGLTVTGVAGDQHAALFGQACFDAGMVKNTLGTGCFLLMHTGTQPVRSQNNLLTTVAWRAGGVTEYALEGSIFIGGAVIQWLRDELRMIENAAEIESLAASVADANGMFLVPAFSGLGAPHWDPWARGTAVGMTRGTNRAHFCRAALESIAYQSADLIACMEKDSGIPLRELRVDGGASQSESLMRFTADLLGVAVARPAIIETTALGAAQFAGLACGFWESREAIAALRDPGTTFLPTRPREEMAAFAAGWARAVETARHWARE